ncbi:RNA polymerase sigma factor [Paenimyroides baculatum]|uniref:Sigma-70 family RNA polymerase sigma factor n=1 Tax=Paenimyroides baculatum TaxID=2608000 RepID=A0A5M6CJJ1_9FLAO|nr:sigma-70 family RNA polymerase sigma factor [Paenimyroides baculatum]KAA5535371.1 sigma-70 family RNA polymerase sigma factor [Paenimyroides baculatum]
MPQQNFELLKKGDPAALEKIHAQYSRRIFWLGKRIIDDEYEVENLVQDTFLRLWDCREKIQDPMHILFFLQYVMKRSCLSHYYKPRNKFFRTVNSLESYENFQNYLAGYDPADGIENLKYQESQQKLFDLITNVLPLIKPERRQLINLCLKYGFRYKQIAQVMGKNTRQTVDEVNRAIEDIKKIVAVRNRNEKKFNPELEQNAVSERQSQVLKLRCEKKFSFAAIAEQLNLSQTQVHEEFMAAYKFAQQHKIQSL